MYARLAMVAAVLLALSIGPGLTRVSTAVPQAQTPSTGAGSPTRGMQDMMKMHEQMMADMKAADAKLDALIKDMNSATGEQKVDAIAAVVNELVRQNKAMHAMMGQMHEHMMGGRGMMMKR